MLAASGSSSWNIHPGWPRHTTAIAGWCTSPIDTSSRSGSASQSGNAGSRRLVGGVGVGDPGDGDRRRERHQLGERRCRGGHRENQHAGVSKHSSVLLTWRSSTRCSCWRCWRTPWSSSSVTTGPTEGRRPGRRRSGVGRDDLRGACRAAGIVRQLPRVRGQTPGLPPVGRPAAPLAGPAAGARTARRGRPPPWRRTGRRRSARRPRRVGCPPRPRREPANRSGAARESATRRPVRGSRDGVARDTLRPQRWIYCAFIDPTVEPTSLRGVPRLVRRSEPSGVKAASPCRRCYS